MKTHITNELTEPDIAERPKAARCPECDELVEPWEYVATGTGQWACPHCKETP